MSFLSITQQLLSEIAKFMILVSANPEFCKTEIHMQNVEENINLQSSAVSTDLSSSFVTAFAVGMLPDT